MSFEKNTIRTLFLDRLATMMFDDIPYFPQVHDKVWTSPSKLIFSPSGTGKKAFLTHIEENDPDCLIFSPNTLFALFKTEKYLTFDLEAIFNNEDSLSDFFCILFLYELAYKNKDKLNDIFPSSEIIFFLSLDFSSFYNWMEENKKNYVYYIKNINSYYYKQNKTFRIVFTDFDKEKYYFNLCNHEKYKRVFRKILDFSTNFNIDMNIEKIQTKVFCDEKSLNTFSLDFKNSPMLLSGKDTIRWDYLSLLSLLKKSLNIDVLAKEIEEEGTNFFSSFLSSLESSLYKKDFKKNFPEIEEIITPKLFIFILHLAIHKTIKYNKKTNGVINLERFYEAQTEAIDSQFNASSTVVDIFAENLKYACCPYEKLSYLRTACILTCKQILNSYPILKKEKLFFLDRKTNLFVRDLFKYHPFYNAKIEKKIKNMIVVTSKNKNKSFAILTQEGDIIPFSYEKCFWDKKDIQADNISKNGNLCSYLRKIVLSYTEKYKREYIKNNMLEDTGFCLCEFTQKYIPVEKITVDHVIPFSKLVQDWAIEEGLILNNIHIIHQNPKIITGIPYSENEFKEKWKEYHEEHAILECIHIDINSNLKNIGREDIQFCKALKEKYSLIFGQEYTNMKL